MGDEMDPEVLADLQLRARTVRERGGQSRGATWHPPTFVDKWPCRNPQCRKPVEVTAETVDRYQVFNGELSKRGEERMDFRAIVYCDPCRDEFQRTAAGRRRGQVDRMALVIRQVKASKNPEGETAAIAQLKAWHHPDVEGLIQAVRARLDGKSGKKVRGEM
jgi:hypothetical protein